MFSNIKEKFTKGFVLSSIIGVMAFVPFGAKAYIQNNPEAGEVVEEVAIVEEATPSETVEQHVPLALQEPEVFESDYGESKIARRMTQAEKNQNAAENDGWGGAITIIAMCIVISALVVLSILFMIFGKVSEAIITSKKKKAKAAASHSPSDNNELAPGEVIAAISIALCEYFGNKHDIEDTHLTIRRMQKAYSPWNSKIYNLRPTLEPRRNQQTSN